MSNEENENAMIEKRKSVWKELFAKYERLVHLQIAVENMNENKTCEKEDEKSKDELFDSLKEDQIAQNSEHSLKNDKNHESQKQSLMFDIFDLSLVDKESDGNDLLKSEKHNWDTTISISSYNLENDFARQISIEEPVTYEILKESLIGSLDFKQEADLLDEIYVAQYSCNLTNVFQQIFSITEHNEEDANMLASLFEQICIVFQNVFKKDERMAKTFFDNCCKFFTLLQGICAQLYV